MIPMVRKILKWLEPSNLFNFDNISNNLRFILFMALICIIHIANNHQATNYIRDINKTEREIKELRWEYMTKKSSLMYSSKQSEIADMVGELGLKELREPPKTIVID